MAQMFGPEETVGAGGLHGLNMESTGSASAMNVLLKEQSDSLAAYANSETGVLGWAACELFGTG